MTSALYGVVYPKTAITCIGIRRWNKNVPIRRVSSRMGHCENGIRADLTSFDLDIRIQRVNQFRDFRRDVFFFAKQAQTDEQDGGHDDGRSNERRR